MSIKFAVVGTGSSALALAGDISIKGYLVNLGCLLRYESRLAPMREKGGIEVSDAAGDGFASLNMITTDIEQLIKGIDVIFIAAPAYHHEEFINAIASYLEPGQFIVFISYFGAIRFRGWSKKYKIKEGVIPIEMQSLPYAAIMTGPNAVRILAVKKNLPAASFNRDMTRSFLEKVSDVFPQMSEAKNVMYSSFNNPGVILFPVVMLMNIQRIESTERKDWNLFSDGVTDSVASILLKADYERLSLGKAIGIKINSLTELFVKSAKSSHVTPEELSYAIRNNAYVSNPLVPCPKSLNHRYITDTVPYGLVQWSSMGQMWNICTPCMDSIIRKASEINCSDYFNEGVGVEEMVIGCMSPEQVIESIVKKIKS